MYGLIESDKLFFYKTLLEKEKKMKRIVVNLGGYGDFDMPTVESVWLAPEGMDRTDVRTLVDEIENNNSNVRDTKKATARLKQEGFTALHNVDCLVGGNL